MVRAIIIWITEIKRSCKVGICIGFMKEVESERGTFSVVRKEGEVEYLKRKNSI